MVLFCLLSFPSTLSQGNSFLTKCKGRLHDSEHKKLGGKEDRAGTSSNSSRSSSSSGGGVLDGATQHKTIKKKNHAGKDRCGFESEVLVLMLQAFKLHHRTYKRLFPPFLPLPLLASLPHLLPRRCRLDSLGFRTLTTTTMTTTT